MSIEEAERLQENLYSYVEAMKATSVKMDEVSWNDQDGVLITGDEAAFFADRIAEWIESTKELIAGPLTASDVNDTNAARVQTRMKYKFVLIPHESKVVCVPKEEFAVMLERYEREKARHGREAMEKIRLYKDAEEYPPVVFIDFK